MDEQQGDQTKDHSNSQLDSQADVRPATIPESRTQLLSTSGQLHPYSSQELLSAFLRPHRAIDVILAQRARWITSVAEKRELVLLVSLMFSTSLFYAVPYGAVIGWDRYWQISALYLGSVAICFSSLHVFSAYLGVRISLAQSLAMAILVSSVAAIFSFGFFPILWFLSATMTDENSVGTVRAISVFLLSISLLAGILQLFRCLMPETPLSTYGSFTILIFFWQALLAFIAYRMGLFLGLF